MARRHIANQRYLREGGPMVRKYFGTDGIRGRANGAITPELALKVPCGQISA